MAKAVWRSMKRRLGPATSAALDYTDLCRFAPLGQPECGLCSDEP